VAAKVLKTKIGKAEQDELIHEAIMTSALNHRNVVAFVGAVLESQPHMLVLEFCSHGSLLSVLQKNDPAK
jgi:serine/threonine protein kinase